jgi:hypothetical protein
LIEVRLSPEAVSELAETAAWYRGRRPGLDLEFLAEVERMLPMIGDSPAAFPRLLDLPVDLVIRRALLPRFPYAVIFMARPPSEMMVQFINGHRDADGVEPICDVLPIAPSLYYERRARQRYPERRPPRTRRDEVLSRRIRRGWHEEREVYGARKVWKHPAAGGRAGGPLHGGTAEAPARIARREPRPKVQADHVPEHRRGLATRSRHAALRGDATESTVGRGPDVRGDVAGLRVCRVRDRRLRPPDRGLARVELAAERSGAR